MGNSYAKFTTCFIGHHHSHTIHSFDPQTQNHGHSFAYLRPQNSTSSLEKQQQQTTTTFHSISGASVSANVSTPLSTALLSDLIATSSAAFESSISFSSVPLQPLSGPLNNSNDRGFMSGPIERTFMSGPLENSSPQLIRSLSHGLPKPRGRSILRSLTKVLTRAVPSSNTAVSADVTVGNNFMETGLWSDSYPDNGLQWAQGKAGEDRVHVVVSEEHEWVFVGIYDGFNGPDATDYLLHNLYDEVYSQLKGLLWDDKDGNDAFRTGVDAGDNRDEVFVVGELSGRQVLSKRRRRRGTAKIGNWERKVSEIDRGFDGSAKHLQVLKALCKALRKTEETYFDIADKMVSENPELALMGSCCLVMLMKGDDVYLMNVGDSRAILGQQVDSDVWRKTRHDLKRINEEVANELEINDPFLGLSNLDALQLTLDHSTSVEEEVRRIRKEHPDDSSAIANDRVKGTLKVTRAFGAGFLKQPKWNDVLLEMFRIDYVGSSPYLTCNPFLYHHKLGPKDKFLILSSDGLYQYITNEEAVSQVEIFMSITPEGDPAQHLVEEVLFRAAKRAGMDFHELLEVPQGDRRRYHDDISIIIISLEGRIWRSCL